MNREFEFRGRDIVSGQFVNGDLEYNRKGDVARIHTYNNDGSYNKQFKVDPNSVEAYTGLKDCNDVKIFEGDVMDVTIFNCFEMDEQYRVVVVWMGSEYVGLASADNGWDLYWILQQDCEAKVIGNIHDNPELKGGKL